MGKILWASAQRTRTSALPGAKLLLMKGKVIAVKRRIMHVLMAVAIVLSGCLVATAPASAEGGYTAKFVRDKSNCYTGTLVITGIPSKRKIDVATRWGPPKPYGGFEYHGKGDGTNPKQWRKHFTVKTLGFGPLHKGKFTMYLTFRDGSNAQRTSVDIIVPACIK